MGSEYPRMSRRQMIESVSQIAFHHAWEKHIYMAFFSYYESYTDTELATYWFKYFGEIVQVGDSRLHEILKNRLIKYHILTVQILQQMMENSRR